MDTEYELGKNALEILEKIIETTTAIEQIYQRLNCLDLLGKKDSEEFRLNTKYLEIALEVETELYKKLNEDPLNCLKSLLYLLKNNKILADLGLKNFGLMYNLVDLIMNNDNKILVRIALHLTDTLCESSYALEKIVTISDERKSNPQRSKKISGIVKDHSKMLMSFKLEILGSLLSLLEDKINNETNLALKKELIYIKYNISLIYKTVEPLAVHYQFDIPSEIIDNINFMICFSRQNNGSYESFKGTYGMDSVAQVVKKLTDIEEPIQDNNQLLLTLSQLYIKSIFMLIDNKTISDFYYILFRQLHRDNYLLANKNSDIVISMLKDVFKNANTANDKTYIKLD